ncbi:helix-turn-helix domain-containing protein [Saccharopolyspora shandongensis]|uniref:helix-turn-helix domain-containing protein n=1 Tax=Saccharopolyspora shandongensis TaxID=418495 RepID=UPI003443F5B4
MTPPTPNRGNAIKARAARHGINVTTRTGAAALADRLGVHPATVYRALNGSTAPGARFAGAYAAAFGSDALVDLYPAAERAA